MKSRKENPVPTGEDKSSPPPLVRSTRSSEFYEEAALSSRAISIITVTNRPSHLIPIVRQVIQQDFPGIIEHIIVADGLELDESTQAKALRLFDETPAEQLRIGSIITVENQEERFIYEKIGALRNLGIAHSRGQFIALWDDDNRWEKDHISSLHSLLDQDSSAAAHSWRRLMRDEENQYDILNNQYPWTPANSAHGEFMYRILHKAGILSEGSNEYRDQHGYTANEKTGTKGSTVDTGEWLIPRKYFDDGSLSFNESYHYLLYHFGATDDPQFAYNILELGIPVVCSKRFSMQYFMQGETKVYRTSQG